MTTDERLASPNTQAVLLLTAPLLAGRRTEGLKPLTTREYQAVVEVLQRMGRQPADLLARDAGALQEECGRAVGTERIKGLLRRGMLLSQALDRWATRGIWVVSRADEGYPARLKRALGIASPPVLYGAGDRGLLDRPALGVVGSREAPRRALEAAAAAGAGAARIGALLVSGNARGVDRTAMDGAAAAGGVVVSVVADGLEKQALVAENRDALHDDRLVIVSPYDPGAGRTVGQLMGRNKVIYGLSDAVLVAHTKHGEGGTWQGAHEHLRRFRTVRVLVQTDSPPDAAQQGLLDLGALVWPSAHDDAMLGDLLAPSRPLPPRRSADPGTVPATDPEPTGAIHAAEPDVLVDPVGTTTIPEPDASDDAAAEDREARVGDALLAAITAAGSTGATAAELAERLDLPKSEVDRFVRHLDEYRRISRVTNSRPARFILNPNTQLM